MDKLQAVHSFWASFGWPAYNENSVPDNAPLPHITHELGVSDLGRPVAQTAQLHSYASGWREVVSKMEQIGRAITRGGKIIPYDGGALIIRKESPWGQDMADTNSPDVRIMLLNYSVEYLD